MELLQKQNKQTLLTLLPARIVGCPKLADATSLALPKSSVLGSASCAYDAYVCLCIISIHFIISSFQWIVNCANLGQEAHGPPPHKTLVIWTETMSSYPVMGCDAVPYPKIFNICCHPSNLFIKLPGKGRSFIGRQLIVFTSVRMLAWHASSIKTKNKLLSQVDQVFIPIQVTCHCRFECLPKILP
jgi:hypothetical protein